MTTMMQVDRYAQSAIERVLQHDRNALEELLLLRYDWLRGIAVKAIPVAARNRITADEVLQDSFVRMLKGFSSFVPQGEASLFLWLKTIVQNTARDAIRKSVRSREAPMTDHVAGSSNSDSVSDLVSSMAVATDPRASVVARDKELSQAFHIALASLDRKYQKVIEVLYFEQLTVEQAAIRLETTEAAVRGLRQRAREKLRDAMVRLSHFI